MSARSLYYHHNAERKKTTEDRFRIQVFHDTLWRLTKKKLQQAKSSFRFDATLFGSTVLGSTVFGSTVLGSTVLGSTVFGSTVLVASSHPQPCRDEPSLLCDQDGLLLDLSSLSQTQQQQQQPDDWRQIVSVVPSDCIDVARSLVLQGQKVCMLNMASNVKAGGGVADGRTAQEEELCRRSSLYPALSGFRYPLGEFEGIYTRDVSFYRQGPKEGYQLYPAEFVCDVVSVAAYRAYGKPLKPTQVQGMETKIKQMLTVAHSEHCDSLVLSAFGCGAYGNDPGLVANLFHRVLVDLGYSRLFKKIVFAIVGQPETNYKVFADKFEDVDHRPQVAVLTSSDIQKQTGGCLL